MVFGGWWLVVGGWWLVVGRGSLGSLEMIETTITLSLPWEAWGREASVLGVTVAGLPFWGAGRAGGGLELSSN